MRNLPEISELPALMSAEGWRWKRNDAFPRDFWLGQDTNGIRWLVKMHGGFYSLREHAFSSLAQHLGLFCQSSVLLRLPNDSIPMKEDSDLEESQIALELLDEHDTVLCAPSCPLAPLEFAVNSPSGDRVALAEHAGVEHASDWIRADMLAYLCGANEPSDRLITKDHEFVVIDNEQMFSTDPVDVLECDWFRGATGEQSSRAIEIAGALCSRLAQTTDEEIALFSSIPRGYVVNELWSVHGRMVASRNAARRYVDAGIFR
jgi:hypothetical protein